MLLGSNPLIQVTPGLMIWTIVCFLISLFVLKRYAFGPIQKLIDERRERIRRALDEAGGLGLIGAVVIKDFLDGEFLSLVLDHDAALIVNLADRQFDAFALVLPGFCFPAGDGHYHGDANFVTGTTILPPSCKLRDE